MYSKMSSEFETVKNC